MGTTSELNSFGRASHQKRDKRLTICGRSTRPSRVIHNLRTMTHMVFDFLMHWRDRRIAIGTLEKLNDHYLRDVGIDRADIPNFVATRRMRDEDLQ